MWRQQGKKGRPVNGNNKGRQQWKPFACCTTVDCLNSQGNPSYLLDKNIDKTTFCTHCGSSYWDAMHSKLNWQKQKRANGGGAPVRGAAAQESLAQTPVAEGPQNQPQQADSVLDAVELGMADCVLKGNLPFEATVAKLQLNGDKQKLEAFKKASGYVPKAQSQQFSSMEGKQRFLSSQKTQATKARKKAWDSMIKARDAYLAQHKAFVRANTRLSDISQELHEVWAAFSHTEGKQAQTLKAPEKSPIVSLANMSKDQIADLFREMVPFAQKHHQYWVEASNFVNLSLTGCPASFPDTRQIVEETQLSDEDFEDFGDRDPNIAQAGKKRGAQDLAQSSSPSVNIHSMLTDGEVELNGSGGNEAVSVVEPSPFTIPDQPVTAPVVPPESSSIVSAACPAATTADKLADAADTIAKFEKVMQDESSSS